MNPSELLTVAIPTYKRPALLDKCIESVFDSANGLNVEVLVMDDSLDSGNESVYEKYRNLGKNIRVVNNVINLGIDANICACIENANARYVWLIGEDDLMKKSGINAALSLIENHAEVPFIYANYSYITADQKKIFRENSTEISTNLCEFTVFFENYLWSAGFIGGCIIRKDAFLRTNYKEFIGTYYAHVAGICLASIGSKIGVITVPQVGNRVGDASTFTWSADSYGVFQGWRKLLRLLMPEFGHASYTVAYQSHISAHGYLGFKFLMGKKADGLLRSNDIKGLLAADTSAAEKRRIVLVGHFVPKMLCVMLRKGYANARRLNLPDFLLD